MAETCTTVFCAMFYSSGMPILLWIAAADLALTYVCDRHFLFHVHAKPPQYDETMANTVASLLPYAALLHLVTGCWIYSAQFVEAATFPACARLLTLAPGLGGLEGAEEACGLALARLPFDANRLTVLPLLAALLLLLVAMLLRKAPCVARCGRALGGVARLFCCGLLCCCRKRGGKGGGKVAPVPVESSFSGSIAQIRDGGPVSAPCRK